MSSDHPWRGHLYEGGFRSLPKKGTFWHNFRSTLTDIYKNWWQKRTNYKTGLHDQAQDPALLQLTLVMLLLLSPDNPPRSFHKRTTSAFLPLTKYDHPQSREKSRGFSFSGAAKSVVHSSEVIISAPVTAAGLLRVSYTPICSYFTAFKPWWQPANTWCCAVVLMSFEHFFFSPQSHTFSFRKYTFSDVRLWLWSPLFYVERTRCYKHRYYSVGCVTDIKTHNEEAKYVCKRTRLQGCVFSSTWCCWSVLGDFSLWGFIELTFCRANKYHRDVIVWGDTSCVKSRIFNRYWRSTSLVEKKHEAS